MTAFKYPTKTIKLTTGAVCAITLENSRWVLTNTESGARKEFYKIQDLYSYLGNTVKIDPYQAEAENAVLNACVAHVWEMWDDEEPDLEAIAKAWNAAIERFEQTEAYKEGQA